MNEFSVCPHGPCAAALVQRDEALQRFVNGLDALMQRCREESYDPTYTDLVALRRCAVQDGFCQPHPAAAPVR